MSEQLLKHVYRNKSNVEIGKFTVMITDSAVYANGATFPGGANAGPIAGIAQESILPSGVADYSSGQYVLVSGTAWPTGAAGSGLGRNISCAMLGISRVVAASAISVGDELTIADNQGRVQTNVVAVGTVAFIVGQALDAATAAGDVIRCYVTLIRRKM